jgi:hypothetical protein
MAHGSVSMTDVYCRFYIVERFGPMPATFWSTWGVILMAITPILIAGACATYTSEHGSVRITDYMVDDFLCSYGFGECTSSTSTNAVNDRFRCFGQS